MLLYSNLRITQIHKHSCLGRTLADGASFFIYLQDHNNVHSYAMKYLKCSFGLPGFEPFWLFIGVLHHLWRSKIKSRSLDSYTLELKAPKPQPKIWVFSASYGKFKMLCYTQEGKF